jgi:CubicO group peptidase (beta-lactamase class C family)
MAGDVAGGYGRVADAFAANFEDAGEDAAAVAVYVDGVKVVDLWGGRDVIGQRDAGSDALMMIASCSKGVTASVLAILIETGRLDPEAPVARYWPEFAASGKSDVTVGMVASHTAGLPYPPLGSGLSGLDLHRGRAVTELLAQAPPLWVPGSAMAYHPVTYGTLLDEIVRRATGADIASHVRSLIAEPLGLDLWIGLPEEFLPRVILDRWMAPPTAPEESGAAEGSYAYLRQRFLEEEPPMNPDLSDPEALREHYTASRPAIGAVTDARSLARMYAALIGEVDGNRLISPETLRAVTAPRTDTLETLVESGTTGPDIRFGLGYQLASPSMPGFGPSTFGHTGAGGRLGVADPERGVAFGYVCSQMRYIGPQGDPRWARLIAAISRSMGEG